MHGISWDLTFGCFKAPIYGIIAGAPAGVQSARKDCRTAIRLAKHVSGLLFRFAFGSLSLSQGFTKILKMQFGIGTGV